MGLHFVQHAFLWTVVDRAPSLLGGTPHAPDETFSLWKGRPKLAW